jgi:hypothetical protein
MGDVPLIDADTFLQCGRPANIPEATLRERPRGRLEEVRWCRTRYCRPDRALELKLSEVVKLRQTAAAGATSVPTHQKGFCV